MKVMRPEEGAFVVAIWNPALFRQLPQLRGEDPQDAPLRLAVQECTVDCRGCKEKNGCFLRARLRTAHHTAIVML
jgi:hypothetical protein